MRIKLKPAGEQVVVVMGASSGIGRAAALRFAATGAEVVVAARGEEGLTTLVAEITAAGGSAVAVVADTSDVDQVRAVADQAVAAYGRIDTWVQAAAVLLVARFEDTTPEEFARVVDVNLMGQVYGAMAALPHLRRQGGALIHVSSMGAKRGIPLQSAYTASKHGIDGLAEAVRTELRHDRVPVSVTTIMPATINTPLFDNARTKIGVKPIAPPPVYPVDVVADAILYAAQHPVRDLVVGGAAKVLIVAESLAPRAVDAVLRRVGYRIHYTKDPKTAEAPDNLFAPLPEHATVDGSVGRFAFRRSAYTWLELRPPLKRATSVALTAAALGAARGGRREPRAASRVS